MDTRDKLIRESFFFSSDSDSRAVGLGWDSGCYHTGRESRGLVADFSR